MTESDQQGSVPLPGSDDFLPPDHRDMLADIAGAALGYLESSLLRSATERMEVVIRYARDPRIEFDVSVATSDLRAFDILLCDGATLVVQNAFAYVLEDPGSGTYETFESLSLRLFGHRDGVEPLLRHAIHVSVIFMALHEFAHIACGHLHLLASLQEEAAVQSGLTLSEARFASLGFGAAPVQNAFLAANLVKYLELEADSVALQILSTVSDLIMLHNDEIGAMIDRAATDAPRPEGVHFEVSLYCVGVALCLVEVVRRARVSYDVYPRPFTRVLSAFRHHIYYARTEEVGGDGILRLTLSDDERHHLVRVLVNLVDACNTACEATELALEEDYHALAGGRFMQDILRDLRLVDREGAGLRTAEAVEIAELERNNQDFLAFMKPFRPQTWGQ